MQFIIWFMYQAESELNIIYEAAGFCSDGCCKALDQHLKGDVET